MKENFFYRERETEVENEKTEAREEKREEDIKEGGEKCGESKKTTANSIKGLTKQVICRYINTCSSLISPSGNIVRAYLICSEEFYHSPRHGSILFLTCFI